MDYAISLGKEAGSNEQQLDKNTKEVTHKRDRCEGYQSAFQLNSPVTYFSNKCKVFSTPEIFLLANK